ncbi:helix-turn-helix domain-containing protein [Aureliella helgolandensis]|uniref:helix-turn-helix domain-containing protein n=1 Tax=Aureliella helgolandensis TaxID=2527968 RepID=UPI00119ECD02
MPLNWEAMEVGIAMDQTVSLSPRLVTARQAAEMLGLSERTLFKLRHQGQLPFVRVGRSIRFAVASLDSWVRQRETSEE